VTAHVIFVLVDSTLADSADEADGKMLSVLVQLQHMLLDSGASEFPPIIPEMHCRETEEMCLLAGCQDFVGSQRLVSRILASVCWEPKMNRLYNHLLSDQGCHFTIKGLHAYMTQDDDGAARLQVSFYEVMARWQKCGDWLIGWTREGSVESVTWTKWERAEQAREHGLNHLRVQGLHDCWALNPQNKSQARPWTPKDRLIVLSHHATLATRSNSNRRSGMVYPDLAALKQMNPGY